MGILEELFGMSGPPKLPIVVGNVSSGGRKGVFIGGNVGHRSTSKAIYGGTHPASGTGHTGSGTPLALSPAQIATIIAYGAVPSLSETPHEGVRAGEVVGHRCWKLKGGLLWSVAQDHHLWEPGVPMTAGQHMTDHGSYGVYAFKNYDDLKTQLGGGRSVYITGTVDMWGEIVEHDRGYRAEYAAIRSIDSIGFLCGFPWERFWLKRRLRRLYVGTDKRPAVQLSPAELEKVRNKANRFGGGYLKTTFWVNGIAALAQGYLMVDRGLVGKGLWWVHGLAMCMHLGLMIFAWTKRE